MEESIKVYFMGSGEIAVPVLKALNKSGKLKLQGVATQPDRAKGRKKVLQSTPVANFAENNNINLKKTSSVNEKSFVDFLKELAPDIILVFSFGQILKSEILNIPSVACVNIHASVLPKYRGASPVAAAILNRDTESGITYMKMDEGLDTGPMYRIEKCPVNSYSSAELEEKLASMASEDIEQVLMDISNGLKPEAQDESKASYAGLLRKSDGLISWNDSAKDIEAKVRAFYSWPGAFFRLDSLFGKPFRVQLFEAEVFDMQGKPGEVIAADKKKWIIACGDKALELKKIKPQGKSEMTGAEFLRGRKIREGAVL